MKVFDDLQADSLLPSTVKEALERTGYALIRQLIPASDVRAVLANVTDVLCRAGWLRPGSFPLDRIPADAAAYGDPDPIFKKTYQEVFNLELFHALPHHPALKSVMRMIVGDQILVHPKPIGRLIFPRCERLVTHAHQDYEFMGGDPEFYTVWIPLHDCPLESGPLRILEGSHRYGIQKHEKENLHVPEIPLDSVTGDDWAQGQFNAGDVLIFHSLTVHAAAPNVSNRMRISLDCRFQDSRRTLNPSNLVFAGESGKSWEKTYSGWRSDTFQYYWRRLSLTLNPTREDIEKLAISSENSALRARYARMASQLI
ncbi:MAG TPA: phytanoyl-CoA dioxygenase family protein [Acidobacteriaceae bacterium]|nr:phytanoyl-CoA dioxygenase family protein [Acidobacteriaceae bacterium]